MIIEKQENLMQTNAWIVAHQVNCKGVMGAGVAKQIRNQLLTKSQYHSYQNFCNEHSTGFLLGKVLYFALENSSGPQVLANLFAEDTPTGMVLDTDYNALYRSLFNLFDYAMNHSEKKTIAIPAYLGCGLAGGDWNHVFSNIIKPIFDDSIVLRNDAPELKTNVTLEIYYLRSAVERLKNDFAVISGKDSLPYISEVWHGFSVGTSKEYIKSWLEKQF